MRAGPDKSSFLLAFIFLAILLVWFFGVGSLACIGVWHLFHC
jgi:hypothetical protein